MSKKTLQDKQQELLLKIEKAKKELLSLEKKQKQKLGEMAIKYDLHTVPEDKLEIAFKKIKEELISDAA